MAEKTSGKKTSDIEKLLEPTKVELEGAQVRMLNMRSRAMYKLLNCEHQLFLKELAANGKSLYYPGQLPLKKPRF